MNYSFEIKENNSLLEQFLRKGLTKETHPHSYEKIEGISNSIDNAYLENKKGMISDNQLKATIDEAMKKIEVLL